MQRKLLGALVSSISVTVLLLALMPVMAIGQPEDRTCDSVGFPSDNKTTEENPRGNHSGEWGSIQITNEGKTIVLTLNEGYEFCVKAGDNPGVVTYSGSATDTYNNAVSHFSWRTTDTTTSSSTPEETTTTVAETTTTTVAGTSSSEATTTTIEATTSSEATTTTEETTDSTLPFTGNDAGDWAAVAASMLMVGGLALLVSRTRHFDA